MEGIMFTIKNKNILFLIKYMKYWYEIEHWFSLDIETREHILSQVGYHVEDNYVYSKNQVFDFEHRYRYNHIGKVIIDE
jgi:hypothetical protein